MKQIVVKEKSVKEKTYKLTLNKIKKIKSEITYKYNQDYKIDFNRLETLLQVEPMAYECCDTYLNTAHFLKLLYSEKYELAWDFGIFTEHSENGKRSIALESDELDAVISNDSVRLCFYYRKSENIIKFNTVEEAYNELKKHIPFVVLKRKKLFRE